MSVDHAASRFAGPTGSHPVTAPTPPTIEQQLAFATATCRHGSFQQYRGGESNDLVPGFVTALQAVTSGHPYLGRTHPWIWAIDVDQPDHPHYQLLKTALADAGLDYVEADSGGTTRAGRHVFVNVAVNDLARTTIIAAVPESPAGVIDYRMQDGGSPIRPPLAPHRHGGISQPIIDIDEALETLQSWAPIGAPSVTEPLGLLPARARALLAGNWEQAKQCGKPAPMKGTVVDRSAVDLSLARSFQEAGYTLADYLAARMRNGCHPSPKAGDKHDGGRKYLETQWCYAAENPTPGHNYAIGLKQLDDYETVINNTPVTRSTRRLLAAFIELARNLGKTELGFSQLDAGLASGLAGSTVSKLCRSEDFKQFVEPVGSPKHGQAQTWRLRVLETLNRQTVQPAITHLVLGGDQLSYRTLHHFPDQAHQVFWNKPGALQATGYQTLVCFSVTDPRTPAEAMRHRLPKAVGDRTFKTRFAELRKIGALVASPQNPKRFVVNDLFDWDAEAKARGVDLLRAEREQRNDTNRLGWHLGRYERGWITGEQLDEALDPVHSRAAQRAVAPEPTSLNGNPINVTTGEIIGNQPLEKQCSAPPQGPTISSATNPCDQVQRPPERPCVACGYPTATLEPTTGQNLHSHCLVPQWIARHLRSTGVIVPPNRIRQPIEIELVRVDLEAEFQLMVASWAA